ncbi:MAG: metallophosphoesterase, partial [Chlamydiae bacterium]|nr:metallophosphoesterase [Chlamydiota bacterium]
MTSFRFAHLSDLHFLSLSFGLSQFFSKRWIGNLNLLLRRRREFDHSLLQELLPLFAREKLDFVLLSGDVSCSSLEQEFLQAQSFTQQVERLGIPVISLPGNHDHYTRKAAKERTFYKFFPSDELREQRLSVKPLQEPWWLITLDTTISTPLFCCHGAFSEEIEHRLHASLATLPPDAKVILANHFPLQHPSLALQREKALLALLQRYPQIKLYLHGHTHQRSIRDARALGLPILVDAGSVSHKHKGSWTLITCTPTSSAIQPIIWEKNHWTP